MNKETAGMTRLDRNNEHPLTLASKKKPRKNQSAALPAFGWQGVRIAGGET
ncbi:MAG TPA: hypothetical protein VJA19_00110 [Pseudomonas sp.]|nr:hypothetical protein [Pseudomonas sp.]